MSKVHEKKNKTSEEYWFEKEAPECKFNPEINRGPKRDLGYSAKHLKGVDKQLERMQRARDEAAFKKRMTERSGFSATEGIEKARHDLRDDEDEAQPSFVNSVDKRKYRPGFAGQDGSQIVPSKKSNYRPSPQRNRPPLHYPKGPIQPRKRPATAANPPKRKQPQRRQSPTVELSDPDHANEKDLVDHQLSKIEDRIDERDPKLYVDVNIGKTGTERHMERIVVYEGDTAESLATEFCQKHNLNDDMREKLKALLEQQIAGVLPKIMEDDDGDDTDGDDKEDDMM